MVSRPFDARFRPFAMAGSHDPAARRRIPGGPGYQRIEHSTKTARQVDSRFVGVAYWVVQLAAWGWQFWWQSTGEAIFASVPYAQAATVWGGVCLTGIVSTDLLRRLARRLSWLALPTGSLLLRLVLSVLALTLISYAVVIALSLAVYDSPVAAIYQAIYVKLPLGMQLYNELYLMLLPMLTWTTVYFSIALIRHRYIIELRHARMAESLQAAELALLKSQLNPHFLFNALNGVRALIAEEPARAQESVTQLARTLRYMLDSGREELVTLARELEMVDDYLALESLRLAERLQVMRDIEPRATTARVPFMLLQALVENAIKHGIAQLREGGTLRMSARIVLVDGVSELCIEVENPRPQTPPVASAEGVGLRNTARRLQLLFGPRARFHLDLSDARVARATVRLPA
jgi:sensor histidine kinase YesM